MKILAIETSCDDTAVALVDCRGNLRPASPKLQRGEQAQGSKLRFEVLKNIISSQIKVHRPFGGVVPNLAKREHAKNLPKIFQKLEIKKLRNLDAVAVTVGPGLEPALWAGIEFAKDLVKKLDKPIIGVNHMEGHLYSNILKNIGIKFPAIALVVSGGHTILLKMDSLTKWKKLGETRDDAAGEAFDKVARLLNLPYPGGPEIQKIAAKGNPKAINFPRPMLHERRFTQTKRGSTRKGTNYEFSFSGLKTAVLYYIRDRFSLSQPISSKVVVKTGSHSQNQTLADIAASFQQAVIDVLVGKTIRAAREYGAKSILLCGGVSANKPLRETLKSEAEKLGKKFFVPGFEFNTDNAVMIAVAAYIQHLRKKKLKIEAQSNLSL